jgi:pyruvate kinase
VLLESGDVYTLHVDGRPATREGTSVSHVRLPLEVEAGDRVLIDDARIELRVLETGGDAVRCEVVRGGELGGRKSLHVPGADLSVDLLGPDNLADLRFAAEQEVDYVAASFVRNAEDVKRLQDALRAQGCDVPVIAKLEDAEAVAHLEDIVAVADGTMVARGDLGAALPVGEVPLAQKRIIRTTVRAGKPVITATQMLDSMERNDRPTRAEASDVANAIFDGTSAVMLSGETARGRHPVLAVRTMAALALQAERGLDEYGALQLQALPRPERMVTDAVAQAAVNLATHLHAAAVLTLTESGFTSRAISKYRPSCPILALTSDEGVVRRLTLNWGVLPMVTPAGLADDEARVAFGIQQALARGLARSGEWVVATAGSSREVGSTNRIRVVAVR